MGASKPSGRCWAGVAARSAARRVLTTQEDGRMGTREEGTLHEPCGALRAETTAEDAPQCRAQGGGRGRIGTRGWERGERRRAARMCRKGLVA